MERPQKRPRLGLSPHDESDDDDELNYEPEEISLRRDPGARLARSRANAAFGLKSAFESIFAKYERDFEGVADEIDLRTADVVVDNHHLERMRNERDMGDSAKETEGDEIPLWAGDAVHGRVGRTGARSDSRGNRDEDQILQGTSQPEKSSALVRNDPGALICRMSSGLGQRPGITSQLGGPPQAPPLGVSPLFFGSWGPPGAMDPAWQAPPLQVPRFKSSFAADLFTGRYQLPAREASKSIWGPGSHSDDEEDMPVETRKPRLAPPTRRVPARPRAMKLIRAPPTDPDDSGDEDCILMGVGASLIPKEYSNPSLHQKPSEMQDDEADRLIDRLERELEGASETECGDATISAGGGQPVACAEEPPAITHPRKTAGRAARNTSHVPHSSALKGKKRSPNKKRKERRVSTPRKALVSGPESRTNGVMAPNSSSLPANHDTHNTVARPRPSVVVELRPSHLLDDSSYLDFSDLTDLPTETSLPEPPLDDQAPPSPEEYSRIAEDPTDDAIPYSDRTVPDSQETPASLPMSSAPNGPSEQTPEKPRNNQQPEKKKPSAYDLSDEEVGFLARPLRKRKPVLDMTSPPGVGEQAPGSAAAGTDAQADTRGSQLHDSDLLSATTPVIARDSSVTIFSPIKTRSARAKTKPSSSSPHGHSPSDDAEDSTRCLSRKRRLTPTSLNSADDTEGELLPAQARMDPSLPVALVSPPPEPETAGTAATAEEHENVPFDAPEPMAAALVDTDDGPPVQGSPGFMGAPTTSKNIRRASPEESGSTGEHQSCITVTAPQESHESTRSSRVTAAIEAPGAALSFPDNHVSSVPPDVVGRSGEVRLTRGRAKEATDDASSSLQLPALPFTEPEPIHQLPNESQGNVKLTPRREQHARVPRASPSDRLKPATPSRTPKHKRSVPDTPASVPSTGHRSLTSLIPRESPDDDSEDELTSSSLWSLFQKPTPTLASSTKSASRRVAPDDTPTKPKRRVSAVRLSSSFGPERPSAPNESVMRTPGGTIRKCGERGLKCGKDFCFTCC